MNQNLSNKSRAPRIAVFVSIPKNASKSVLEIFNMGENRDVENTCSPIIYENHQTARALNAKYNLNRLFVFCFSRNPYDRCISWYEYHRDIYPYNSYSFKQWVSVGLPHHWTKQNETDYVSEDITPLLQYNFVGNFKIDFVGRVDNLSEDLKLISEKLNSICISEGLPNRYQSTSLVLNKSKRYDWLTDYYNKSTKQSVYSLLEKDFEHFGYDK